MNNFTWSIKDVTIENEMINSAKYHVSINDELGKNTVETEGNWYFNGKIDKLFSDITEQDVIDLIKKEAIKDGLNIIESRLDEQLTYLTTNVVETPAPWLPQVFTPNV